MNKFIQYSSIESAKYNFQLFRQYRTMGSSQAKLYKQYPFLRRSTAINGASQIKEFYFYDNSQGKYRIMKGDNNQRYRIYQRTINSIDREGQIFLWRYKASKPIIKVPYIQIISSQSQNIQILVYTDEIRYKFSQLSELGTCQILYLLKKSLHGYESIYNKLGYVHINAQFGGITAKGQCKVWINANFSENEVANNLKLFNEVQIVQEILKLIKKTANVQAQYFFDKLNDEVLQQKKTFKLLEEYINFYITRYQITIPIYLKYQNLEKTFTTVINPLTLKPLKSNLNFSRQSKNLTQNIKPFMQTPELSATNTPKHGSARQSRGSFSGNASISVWKSCRSSLRQGDMIKTMGSLQTVNKTINSRYSVDSKQSLNNILLSAGSLQFPSKTQNNRTSIHSVNQALKLNAIRQCQDNVENEERDFIIEQSLRSSTSSLSSNRVSLIQQNKNQTLTQDFLNPNENNKLLNDLNHDKFDKYQKESKQSKGKISQFTHNTTNKKSMPTIQQQKAHFGKKPFRVSTQQNQYHTCQNFFTKYLQNKKASMNQFMGKQQKNSIEIQSLNNSKLGQSQHISRSQKKHISRLIRKQVEQDHLQKSIIMEHHHQSQIKRSSDWIRVVNTLLSSDRQLKQSKQCIEDQHMLHHRGKHRRPTIKFEMLDKVGKFTKSIINH